MKKLKIIDLFSGCGGLTEGFEQTGKYDLLAAVEWDMKAALTLRHRLCEQWKKKNTNSVVVFDIQRTSELINGFANDPVYGTDPGLDSRINKNKIDVIIGGPPCQAYSVAGRVRDKDGMHNDYRNYLFESYLKVVNHYKPPAFIFENVPGIFSATPGGVPILSRIQKSFHNAGYFLVPDLKTKALVDASQFGVPQSRKRVIIFGVSMSHFKNAAEIAEKFYSSLSVKRISKAMSVEEAIFDLSRILPLKVKEKGRSHFIEKDDPSITDHVPRYHNERDIKIFKMLAQDIENGLFRFTNVNALKELYHKITGNDAAIHKYYVLRRDKPSNTIPAHLYKDGLRHIHPDSKQSRSITVREAARLQSFPDDFTFCGSMGDKYKMIGNAVPPVLAKSIAEALFDTIRGVDG